MTRRVCVVVHNRANYARIKSFLKAAEIRDDLELVILAGSSAVLERFGNVAHVMEEDGFRPDALIYSSIEGSSPVSMAKSTGLLIIELTSLFDAIRPDVVLTVADRYETIATAIAATYLNIPLAHTQGGEVSGSIDESVRHAVTKLAQIHFPATERAKDFLIRMGENANRVFLTGCPSIDLIVDTDLTMPDDFFHRTGGVGHDIQMDEPYVVAMLHPVTTEYGRERTQVDEFLGAVKDILANGIQVVWLWPNIDAGSETISSAIRHFREIEHQSSVRFYKNFSPEDYLRLLNSASCLMGNSSSGIRESAFLGLPSVNIGARQHLRERASNVVDVDFNRVEIRDVVLAQVRSTRLSSSPLFGDGTAGKQIAELLSNTDLSIEKSLNYLHGQR